MFLISFLTDLLIYILLTGESIMFCAYDFYHLKNTYFIFESSKYVNGFFFFIYTTSAEKFRKTVRKRIKKLLVSPKTEDLGDTAVQAQELKEMQNH